MSKIDRMRALPVALLMSVALLAADPTLDPEKQRAVDRISADSMRGHLSFLASDLLEGRDTPSRGLDLAAEYIAAQFRRAGLEPVGDEGYFQTANWLVAARDPDLFELKLSDGSQTINLAANQVSVTS